VLFLIIGVITAVTSFEVLFSIIALGFLTGDRPTDLNRQAVMLKLYTAGPLFLACVGSIYGLCSGRNRLAGIFSVLTGSVLLIPILVGPSQYKS